LEDANEYLFRIDLPELEQEDIQMVVERDGLVVSGVRPEPLLNGRRCLRVERPHGYFERRFALPDDASKVDIASDFGKGVLELHVRKFRATQVKSAPAIAPARLKLRSTS